MVSDNTAEPISDLRRMSRCTDRDRRAERGGAWLVAQWFNLATRSVRDFYRRKAVTAELTRLSDRLVRDAGIDPTDIERDVAKRMAQQRKRAGCRREGLSSDVAKLDEGH